MTHHQVFKSEIRQFLNLFSDYLEKGLSVEDVFSRVYETFKERSHWQNVSQTLLSLLLKLGERHSSPPVLLAFCYAYLTYRFNLVDVMDWATIKPLTSAELIPKSSLDRSYVEEGVRLLASCVCMKLNGGLGTSMGCEGPKSLIPIHEGLSFLDIIMAQLETVSTRYESSIPLLLLNSFNTADRTRAVLKGRGYQGLDQHAYPKIAAKSGGVFQSLSDSDLEWNPAGHGDVYLALYVSGVLADLLSQGKRYLFISNADNLGATFDPLLLGFMATEGYQFMMETTPKTALDVKGGTLINYKGAVTLLERAQVPDEHVASFEDTSLFSVFNTNNIWVDLVALKEKLDANDLQLPIIVNKKQCEGVDVIQLESAMGAAISNFDRACSVVVGRDRFFPVKKTSDLLLLRSDLILKDMSGQLSFDVSRSDKPYPLITLDDHYTTVQDFEKRFPCIPSLKQIDRLDIHGDITFGPNVVLKGQVSLESKGPVVIDNMVIENDHVSFKPDQKPVHRSL